MENNEKIRYRISSFSLLYSYTACFILHNICINNGDLSIWNEDVNFNLFNNVDGEPDKIVNDNDMRNYIPTHE